MLLGLLVAALGGLIVGSSSNLVASRLAAGASPLTPPPQCPACQRRLRPRDLIPLLSWLRLHGRCRDCDAPISRRHPLVESLTGVLFAAVVIAHHDDAAELVLGLALVAFLVALALIDLDQRRLPVSIIAAAAVMAVVLGTLLDAPGEPERLLAAAAAGGLVLLAALAHPRGPAIADVALAAVLGLFLGREAAAAVLLAAVLAGILRIRRGGGEGRATGSPFGVLLALGGLAGLLFGDALVRAYLAGF